MGNWTRVKIEGTCSAKDVPALGEALDPGKDWENFHCLVCGGICGLPNWASSQIDVVGNLAERDYNAESVAETLIELMKIAPTLSVKVHVGGDYESDECVATVTANNGTAKVGEPEVTKIPELDAEVMQSNMLAQLLGRL